MGKIAIVTDSTTGLDYIEGYEDIKLARTTIIMDGQEFIDGIDITPKTFYDKLDDLKDVPKTAQPSLGVLLEMFTELKDEGYTDIIYISISEHLSGTYQSVCMAKDMIEGIVIHPFNSKAVTFVEGFMVMEAYRLVNKGKSVEEILEYLNKLRDNDRIIFMVDNLQYLVKNGRLSNASAFLATMLKIKPLLEVNEEGKVVAKEKIRTTKKAINRVIECFLEETNDGKDAKFLFLFNTDAPEHVKYIKEKLEEKGIDTSKLIDSPVTPSIGCHAGKGVAGIGYIKNFE